MMLITVVASDGDNDCGCPSGTLDVRHAVTSQRRGHETGLMSGATVETCRLVRLVISGLVKGPNVEHQPADS